MWQHPIILLHNGFDNNYEIFNFDCEVMNSTLVIYVCVFVCMSITQNVVNGFG